MRICVISTPVFQLPCSGYSGLEHLAWQTAKGLAERGESVSLVAPYGSTCPGVDVIETVPAGHFDEKTAYDRYWRHLPSYDVIIDHSWQKFSHILKMEGHLPQPVLSVMHAPVAGMYGQLPPVPKPCMVCISNDHAESFRNMHPGHDVRVAYNGVSPEIYKPMSIPRSDRYLFLARFSTIKGPDLAIKACLEAGVGLDLVGDTSITNEPDYLRQCMSMCDGEQIRFVGPADRGECVWWFSQAKALLHPNERFREPFGLAPVEAMMCFPADTPVRASGIQRTYTSSYTGTLLKLHTDYGTVECTPEHPFMTQRGWVAAKDLTLADSLTRVRYDRHRVDEERIGSLVQRLSNAGHGSGREVTQQIEGFGQIKGQETWIVERGQTTVYKTGDEDNSGRVSRGRLESGGEIAQQDAGERRQEGTVHGHSVQTRFGGLYPRGSGDNQEELFCQGCDRNCEDVTVEKSGKRESKGPDVGFVSDTQTSLQTSSDYHDTGRSGVFSRPDRRRRNYQFEKSVWEEDSSAHSDHLQHLQANDRLGEVQTTITERSRCQVCEQKEQRVLQGKPSRQVDGILSRLQVPGVLQNSDRIFGNQEASNGDNIRVVQDSFVFAKAGGTAEEITSASKDASLYEFARLRHISGREVRNLPVYNLGTCTGDYEAAGYLVHNCGCPVISWDYGACKETVVPGVTGFRVRSLSEMVDLIRSDAVSRIDRNQCREWAMQFSESRMIDRYLELCREAVQTGGW